MEEKGANWLYVEDFDQWGCEGEGGTCIEPQCQSKCGYREELNTNIWNQCLACQFTGEENNGKVRNLKQTEGRISLVRK